MAASGSLRTIGSMEHQWDPQRRMMALAEPRLNRAFIRNTHRFATVTEYAQACDVDTATVVELLGDYLDDGTLGLEVVDGEVFVHTAPHGRPAPSKCADVPPNLWERLRSLSDVSGAKSAWKLVRALEQVGWRTETDRDKVLAGLTAVVHAPFVGVFLGSRLLPVLPYPDPDALLGGAGLLTEYHRSGSSAVAVVCAQADLDVYVTAVRRWTLGHSWPPDFSVVLLEAPRFSPVVVSPSDGAVRPVAVQSGVDDELGS